MPSTPPFLEIRSAAEGLLKLSEAVAERAKVAEGALGQEIPLRAVPKAALHQISCRRQFLQFSPSDLKGLQVGASVLSAFEFPPGLRSAILSQSPGHTELERRPIVLHGGLAYLLLPTAVGSAITRLVVDTVLSMGLGDSFETALADDFAKLFGDMSLLGGRSVGAMKFQRIPGGRATGMVREVDPGRFLHLVPLMDGLAGFKEGGLNGRNQDPELWGAVFEQQIRGAAANLSGQPGFRGCVSVLVLCGFGRAVLCVFKADLPSQWRVESISSYDLVTLSWLSEFDALSLWRLLDARDALSKQGVELMNVNGLLNLVAWSRYLRGHLVPHGQVPDSAGDQGDMSIWIQQNMLREVRREVIADLGPRRVRDLSGRWIKAIKLDKTYFDEDNRLPMFGSHEDLLAGELRGIYLAPRRPWWVQISAQDGAPTRVIFDYWKCSADGSDAPHQFSIERIHPCRRAQSRFTSILQSC
jgi:hypothetical protein